jgi:putative transposase
MRKPRLEFEGAFYHVIARGNHRQKVFLDTGDYVRYLKYLGETLRDRCFKLYAYCLMGNHVHLFLEQGSEFPLSRAMHRLQTAYTYFFNKRHHKPGHLFQGRYKAILVDSDAYLLQLVRYIHLNPRRAKIEEVFGKYQWSSHGQYLKREKEPLAPVEVDAVLRMFSKIKKVARKRYQEYMLEGLAEGHRQDLYDLRDGRILGDEDFEEEVHRESGSGLKARVKIGKTIEEIWGSLLIREKIEGEPVGWKRSRLMREAVYWIVECAGKRQKEAADYFEVRPSAIHWALKQQEFVWKKTPEEKRRKEAWARSL